MLKLLATFQVQQPLPTPQQPKTCSNAVCAKCAWPLNSEIGCDRQAEFCTCQSHAHVYNHELYVGVLFEASAASLAYVKIASQVAHLSSPEPSNRVLTVKGFDAVEGFDNFYLLLY